MHSLSGSVTPTSQTCRAAGEDKLSERVRSAKLEPTLVGQAKHSHVSEESCDALENFFEVHPSIAGQSTSLLDRSLYRRYELCEHDLLRQNPKNRVM